MVRAGQRPGIFELQQLTVGESSRADVERYLGEPFGKGASYLPFQKTPRDLWAYYYEEGTLEDDRRTFLFVYLRDQVYDGHMWFSSLPDADKRGIEGAAE